MDNVENRVMRVNMNKTKVTISGEWQKVMQKAAIVEARIRNGWKEFRQLYAPRFSTESTAICDCHGSFI